ncbi:MAG: LuxR C-terminal-related transcriptional regulator [Anaerolineae bacterium]|jgi:DNA-binding CsgD family transcriptional regulator/CheY-like chemotaxis protein
MGRVGQTFTALRWELIALEQALPDRPPHGEIRTHIHRLYKVTDRAMENLRRMVHRLRPAALELGLIPALITYADECSARYPFTVDVEIVGPRRCFPEEVEVTLYRIAQEAVTNVARHAQATRVRLTLETADHQVCLTVADDGVGIDGEAIRRTDEAAHLEMLNAGAEGYIPKRASPEDLFQAIRVVARGEVYLYPTLAGLLVRGYLRCLQVGQAEPEKTPTPRQQEVLRLLAEGLTSREIAERLGLSVKTVEHHRENIMERLGLRTRADLIRYALQKGLITRRAGVRL